MIASFVQVFLIYSKFGLIKGMLAVVRILILPFWKIDKTLPKTGIIIDIGCGDGGLTNYLYLSNQNRTLIGIDMSRLRIGRAKKTMTDAKKVKFIYGDVTKESLPKAKAYFMVDVLHHIAFPNQLAILKTIFAKISDDAVLVIKDVDHDNYMPFLFGHLFEKILYPKETIFTRGRKEWLSVLNAIGFSVDILTGAPQFPDSTLIFVCRRK